jgi:hypothetical protein
VVQVLKLLRERAAQTDFESGEREAVVFRILEHVDAALIDGANVREAAAQSANTAVSRVAGPLLRVYRARKQQEQDRRAERRTRANRIEERGDGHGSLRLNVA